MNEEEHKRITREFIEGLNNKDRTAMLRLIDEDYTFHNFQGTFKGADEFYDSLQVMFDAFPDLNIHVEDQVADDTKVVNRVRLTGTHKGEFAGVPATDKHIDASAMAMYRFKGDKISELWAIWDVMTMVTQMGARPRTS